MSLYTSSLSRSCLVAASLALFVGSAVDAQVISSGLLHSPTGTATFGPPAGRRLPVQNIGSSGNDGVEIRMHSMLGGGVGIDLGDFPVGTSARTKYKGWDGTIKGYTGITRLANGLAQPSMDFPGAIAIKATTYDLAGVEIGTVITPGGGPLFAPPYPYQRCPDGSWPVFYERYYFSAVTHSWTLYYIFACPGEDQTYTYEGRRANTTYEPIYNGGLPVTELESMIVSTSGLPEITLDGADLNTFHAECTGLGDAFISEECSTTTGACAENERKLVVSNIGSSGQDGVEVKWRSASVASVGLDVQTTPAGPAMSKAMYDWIKPSWDSPKREIYTIEPDPSGQPRTKITIDRSELGDCFVSVNGTIAGNPSGGTGTGGGGSSSIIIYIDGMYWGTYDHTPFWVKYFLRTTIGGIGGNGNSPTPVTVIADGMVSQFLADSIDIDFSDAPAGAVLGGMQVTQPNGGQFSLSSLETVAAEPPCSGDFNGDGFLDFTDFDAFVTAFEAGSASGDFNGDGFIDFTDFDAFVAAFEVGC
jgi:hypothetical protein